MLIWRWATVHDCILCLRIFLQSLRQVFDPAAYKSSRDTTRLKYVEEALASYDWHAQLEVIRRYTEMMTQLLLYCGKCRCFEQHASVKARDMCPHKGRLLPEAYPYATTVLREALNEVNGW